MNEFFKNYIDSLKELLDQINFDDLNKIVNTIKESVENKSKIYVIGNGGSASTASHMANDFGIGLKRRNIINIDILSLCDNSSVTTAIANDIGYDEIFYMQLKDILKPEDTLIAISCSGNSPNIIKAVNYAKEVGAKVIGVTGFDGGDLKANCDLSFHVQTQAGKYGLVEDMHMILDHIIYSYFIEKDKV